MKALRMLAVMNQKGGVGKTTTTLNLAHALAREEKRVLVMDLDPQGHLSSSFGVNAYQSEGMAEILLDNAAMGDLIKPVRDNLYLLPAGARLGEVEGHAQSNSNLGYRLNNAVNNFAAAEYDFILIDCPPASGLLAMNALLACKELLIPVTGDYLALQGLSRLIKVVTHIEQRLEINIRKWFVLTRYQERRKLAKQIREKMQNYFPGQVLNTAIRENVSLAESPGFAKTIFDYRPKSKGAEDYYNLAIDLLEQRTIH